MDDVSIIANENLKSRMAEVDHCRNALAKRAVQLWDQMKAYRNAPASSNQSTTPFS